MASLPEIDGYSDLVRVAKGGFGIVYRAKQDRHDRVVALKVLTVDDLDDRGQQRFERECRAMGSLSWHPNVVALLDSGITVDGHPFLAMEYLEGGSFGERLRNGPLSWEEAVVAGVQVAGALDVAHAAGTLHRDLKPENILVGPYGEAKLGDFGIAAVENAVRTTTGHASFTVDHVAPEVLRGQRPDERSDLYGLASTLHTLISGASPYAGEPDAPIATQMMRVLEAPTPRLDGVPEDLADLLSRTLSKEPADRPDGAAEFGRLLQSIQTDNHCPVTELRLSSPTSTDHAEGVSSVDDAATIQRPRPPQPATDTPAQVKGQAPPRSVIGDPRPTIIHTAPADRLPQTHRSFDDSDSSSIRREVGSSESGHARPSDKSDRVPPEANTEGSTEAGAQPVHPQPSQGSSAKRRRLGRIIPAAVLAFAGLGVAVILATRDNGASVQQSSSSGAPASTTSPTETTDDALSAEGGLPIAATVDVSSPQDIAITDDAVWIVDSSTLNLLRINPATNEIADEIDTQSSSGVLEHVAARGGAIWLSDPGEGPGDPSGQLRRIDPDTGEIAESVTVGLNPQSLVVTNDAVWVTRPDDDTVVRVESSTLDQIVVECGDYPDAIASTADSIWVTNSLDDTVSRIDRTNNEITQTIDVGATPVGVASSGDTVWVANRDDLSVSRIDATSGEVTTTIDVDDRPIAVAATASTAWVLTDSVLYGINKATDRIVSSTDLGDSRTFPTRIASREDDVWVSRFVGFIDGENGEVVRFDASAV